MPYPAGYFRRRHHRGRRYTPRAVVARKPAARTYVRPKGVLYRRKAHRMGRIQRLVGQEPESAIQRIARDYVGPLATVAKTVAGIAELVNSENKCVDYGVSGSINNTPSFVLRITAVSQGDSLSQRDGSSILLQNMHGRLTFTPSTTASVTQMGLALVLVKDCKPYTASAPTWANIFGNIGGTNTSCDAPVSKDVSSNVVILKRWCKVFHTYEPLHEVKFNQSLKDIHCTWEDDGTTIQKNHIYLVGRTENVNTVTPSGIIRFTFTDN